MHESTAGQVPACAKLVRVSSYVTLQLQPRLECDKSSFQARTQLHGLGNWGTGIVHRITDQKHISNDPFVPTKARISNATEFKPFAKVPSYTLS